MTEQRSNWAGSYTFTAARYHYPKSLEEIQALVSRTSKLRVLGSGHSFNDIVDTPEDIVLLTDFEQEVVIDAARHTVTVGAGVKYGQICRQLDEAGYALHNMASLPHISIAGACATATHGSGDKNANLASAVAALEIVTADGKVVELSRDQNPDQFPGAVVGLGGLGVITKVTLDIVPKFEIRQDLYENLPFDQLEAHFDEIMSSAYSVSLFTDWQKDRVNQVWLKSQVDEGIPFELQPELFGAKAVASRRHPIETVSAEACTEQRGIPGPWYERLPHFRMDFTPSSGEELQTEYMVLRSQAVAALQAVNQIRDKVSPLLQISEIRSIATDNLWMSTCYEQDSIGIHFTWLKDWDGVRQILPLIEEALAPVGARPHWGKLFTMEASRVQSLYPRLGDFKTLLQTYDPQGKFRNAFLDKYIFG